MSRRALLIALVVSLAANLFLVGAITGALVIGARAPGLGLRAHGPLWTAADGLSPERRQAYRKALRGEIGGVGGKLRQARVTRRQAWLSLRDEDFDPAAAVAALGRARELEAAARSDIERRVVDFAAGLTPAERATLADGLVRAGPGRALRHGRPPLAPPPEAPPARE